MGFTSHDEDLFFDGVNYEATTGFEPSVVDTTADMSVDNLDVEGMLSDDRITEDDIAAGLYDFAKNDNLFSKLARFKPAKAHYS